MSEKLTNEMLLEGILNELRQKNEFDVPKSAPAIRAITDVDAFAASAITNTTSFSAAPNFQDQTRAVLKMREALRNSSPQHGTIEDERIMEGIVQELSAPNEHE